MNFKRKFNINPIAVMNGKHAYESVIANIQSIQQYNEEPDDIKQ
jgi:hypothetical protein